MKLLNDGIGDRECLTEETTYDRGRPRLGTDLKEQYD